MNGLTGSGASQLVQAIKKFGHNNDYTIELATVSSPAPDIKIKLDGSNLELDKEFIMICSSLLEHTRKLNDGTTETSYTFSNSLEVGDRVLIATIETEGRFIILDKVVAFV